MYDFDRPGLRRLRKLLIAAVAFACVLVAVAAPRAQAEARRLNVDFDAFGGYGVYDPAALANPLVDAVNIMLDWNAAEPAEGTYDFGPADAVAEAWAKAGKRFVIVIRYTNEAPHNCEKQQHLPRWLMTKVPYFCDAVFGNIIPNYFDGTFKTELKRFVQRVGEHFAKSAYKSSLLYVRVGVGLGSEGFYLTPCRRTGPCDFENSKAKLVAWGWTPQAWKRWQIEMLTAYKQAFPYTRVIYPVVRLDVDPSTGNPIQMDVAYWAASNGFGLGALGLSPRFADGPARIREILLHAARLNPSTFIQLQTVRPVQDRGEMEVDIALAEALGARAIEWYANDVVDPEYQETLGKWSGTR